MLTAHRLRDLARLSIADPEKGGREILALNPPLPARWLALAAAVVLGVVVAYMLPLMAGQTEGVLPPFAAVGMQAGVNILAIFLMTHVGRMFGGQGRLEDALLLVAWLQALMIAVQGVQLVVLLILPPLAGLVTILAVALFFWLLTGFVQALHGFPSRPMVLLGVLASLFVAAFVLSFFLLLIGFDPRVMTDV
jgi:hypothetical protein